MLAEQFYQILDQLAKWRLGTFPGSAGSTGRPPLDPDAAPENPYPVVETFNPTASTCDWCDAICVKRKTYSKITDTNLARNPNSGCWQGYCSDCKEKRIVTTEEMISFGRFTIAKDL
jgi:hypothetical protein